VEEVAGCVRGGTDRVDAQLIGYGALCVAFNHFDALERGGDRRVDVIGGRLEDLYLGG